MTDYMTQDARSVAICAYENAIRLGHHYLGGEHFLLALAAADQPAGAALRGRGVTPERVEEEIVRLAGAACSATWTGTRSPLSGSTLTLSATGSSRPSARRPSSRPPGPLTGSLAYPAGALAAAPALCGMGFSSRTPLTSRRACGTPAVRRRPGTPLRSVSSTSLSAWSPLARGWRLLSCRRLVCQHRYCAP